MAQHSFLHECILKAELTRKEEYNCTNRYDLRKKIVCAFYTFKVNIVDPVDNCTRIRTESYWNARGIKKQTICSWHSKIKKAIHEPDSNWNKLKLNYAFYFALLCETTLEDAISFMAISGYPYNIYPDNHEYFTSIEARCFSALAYVYTNLESPSVDSNTTRYERLELADWYIDMHDPSLLDVLIK